MNNFIIILIREKRINLVQISKLKTQNDNSKFKIIKFLSEICAQVGIDIEILSDMLG